MQLYPGRVDPNKRDQHVLPQAITVVRLPPVRRRSTGGHAFGFLALHIHRFRWIGRFTTVILEVPGFSWDVHYIPLTCRFILDLFAGNELEAASNHHGQRWVQSRDERCVLGRKLRCWPSICVGLGWLWCSHVASDKTVTDGYLVSGYALQVLSKRRRYDVGIPLPIIATIPNSCGLYLLNWCGFESLGAVAVMRSTPEICNQWERAGPADRDSLFVNQMVGNGINFEKSVCVVHDEPADV
ncbi:hypothetical protein LY76DRAFT_102681 [Colletotrichum caudatum]|nr:hypothetical protein LY76DRAFT_102681 [Colletotrichum caudatum]